MSAKSRNSSTEIDRPFDRQVLKDATEIANQYQIILSQEEGVWYGRGLELSGTFGDGKTPAACVTARGHGYKGMSDYIRAAALRNAS